MEAGVKRKLVVHKLAAVVRLGIMRHATARGHLLRKAAEAYKHELEQSALFTRIHDESESSHAYLWMALQNDVKITDLMVMLNDHDKLFLRRAQGVLMHADA